MQWLRPLPRFDFLTAVARELLLVRGNKEAPIISESYPLATLLIQTIGAIATAAAAIAVWLAANESRSASREMRARRHEERQQGFLAASTAAFWRLTQRLDDLAVTRTHAGQAS